MRHHPLQIPGGWIVAQNHFFDITPEAAMLESGRLDFPFVEDILQLTNDYRRMALDLGWYPDGDPNGHYRLVLIQWDAPPKHNDMPKQSIATERNGIEYTYQLQPLLVGDAWSKPLVDFSSRDQGVIVTRINDTLAKVESGELGSG